MSASRRLGKARRSLVVAALSASLIVPPSLAGSADSTPPYPAERSTDSKDATTSRILTRESGATESRRGEGDREPSREHEGSRSSDSLPWIAVGAIGAAAIAAALHARQKASDDSLTMSGPRIPDVYGVGSFPVQGYTRGGWPLAVDFLPEPDSRTWVEVAIDGRLLYQELLDPDGRGGRQLVRIVLPSKVSDKPRPGLYVIHSVRLAGGQVLKDANGRDVAANLEIYGIGAGPKAVGSVAIDGVVFEPGRLRFQPGARGLASYSYNARSEFNRAAVEILRFDNRAGEIHVERVKSENLVGVRLGRSPSGGWDGTTDTQRAPSFGLHRLQVRAWFNSEDRSWVGAWSPTAVTVSP